MLSKGNKRIKFDVVIPKPCGAIYAWHIQQGLKLGAGAIKSATEMNIQHVPELFGCCNEQAI